MPTMDTHGSECAMARRKIDDRGAGGEVRRLRDSLGMTQAALAGKVALSPQYLAAIERGERTGWNPDLLFRLSSALGVPCEHWRPYFVTLDAPAADPAPVADATADTAKPEPRKSSRKSLKIGAGESDAGAPHGADFVPPKPSASKRRRKPPAGGG